jgi:uncharacterized protein YutD
MLGCVFSCKGIYAYMGTSGSLELNYQRMKTEAARTYTFGQRLRLNIKDNLWVKNQLLLSADLFRNQFSGQERTDFRPRFNVDLSGYKYRAFYSLTPYKRYLTAEHANNYRVVQASLSINPTSWPDLVFSYRHSHVFDDLKVRKSDRLTRYWTLSSRWQYRSLSLNGSFIRQEGIDKITSTKDNVLSAVTGGGRFNFNLPLRILTSWDYDFSFTKRETQKSAVLKTPSHSFSTRWGGQPWRFLSWSANYQGKFVRTKRGGQTSKRDAHTFYGGFGMHLTPRWEVSLNRGLALSKADGEKSTTDYIVLATNFESLQVIENLEATGSFRRTYYLRTDVGSYALNLFYLSSRMIIYPQIEVRSDFTVNYNDNPRAAARRYRVLKNVNLVTRPRRNLEIALNYQTTMDGTKVTFLYSEIENYRMDLTYWGKSNFSLRTSYQANLYEKRNIPNSYSLSAEISYPYRNLFSSSVVYTSRWIEDPQTGETLLSDNLSSQVNFSLRRRTKVSLTYYVTNLGDPTSTSNLGVTLNRQF